MSIVKFPFDTEKLFQSCVRNKTIPKNDFQKQAVLIRIIAEFSDRKYTEPEVNKIIAAYFEDFATIRRELINFGYMQRNPLTGDYWVLKREITEDYVRHNTLLRRHSKPYKALPEDRE
ncbi:DUF2087 domain-containing protein [Candidatus Woesearchaeota archaeon]|nr:DUF2087 domain-containing protein [Candidatus Woesearchaeota archaeon]